MNESLADQAYKSIEAMILRAELPPGTWIAETAIAERIGFGRTPVREAVQRLSLHRLIEIVPGRGLRVTDINVKEQLLVIELRREIELLLVRRATKYSTVEERRELTELAAAMARLRHDEAATDFYKLDLDFKILLIRCAKHRYAADAIAPLWSASRRFAWVHRTVQDTALVADQLRRLMIAIAAGDEEAAAEATQERMDYLDRFARATLRLAA